MALRSFGPRRRKNIEGYRSSPPAYWRMIDVDAYRWATILSYFRCDAAATHMLPARGRYWCAIRHGRCYRHACRLKRIAPVIGKAVSAIWPRRERFATVSATPWEARRWWTLLCELKNICAPAPPARYWYCRDTTCHYDAWWFEPWWERWYASSLASAPRQRYHDAPLWMHLRAAISAASRRHRYRARYTAVSPTEFHKTFRQRTALIATFSMLNASPKYFIAHGERYCHSLQVDIAADELE